MKTAQEVLEWAHAEGLAQDWTPTAEDRATAERFALALRVLAVVEREARKYNDIEAILAEASKGDK